MYWTRTGNPLDILLWVLLSAGWLMGGWLLVSGQFRLRRIERLTVGMAAGFLLFIVLSNLAAYLLPMPLAFWLASAAILLAGWFFAWKAGLTVRGLLRDFLRGLPVLGAMGLLALFFLLLGRGMAIFDEFHNLPLVSTLAAGDFPPHFYLNPAWKLAYHYGLHLFSASMVVTGRFFPWSAFDFVRALTIALTVTLSWLWAYRLSRSPRVAYLAAGFAMLVGGARWLLALLPPPWIVRIGAGLELLGTAKATGPDLYSNLAAPWVIEGAGQLPYAFAYTSGILQPLPLALGGSSAAAIMTALLLALLYQRRWNGTNPLIFSLLLASLALTAETALALLMLGLGAAHLWLALRQRSLKPIRQAIFLLLPALLLSVLGGGVLTEFFRGLAGPVQERLHYTTLRVYWPPQVISAHLGRLSLFKGGDLLLAALEAGPAVLLLPLLWKVTRRGLRRQMVFAVFGLAALSGMLIPLFFNYAKYERDITRVTSTGLLLGALLVFPYCWQALEKSSRWLRYAGNAWYSVAVFSGLVILSVQLTALPHPQLSYFINSSDALIAARFWNTLPAEARVLDPDPYRAVTLFGRPAEAYVDLFQPSSEWERLVESPRIQSVRASGYDYIYMDEDWWKKLNNRQRQDFDESCVRIAGKEQISSHDFRILYDLRDCPQAALD